MKVIFLHHSVGLAVLEEGGLRSFLQQINPAIQLWDHGYNNEGLRNHLGVAQGRNFDIPQDETTPPAYAALFHQPVHSPPDNAFSHLMEYDAIIFKTCFPTSSIVSDAQLEEYKAAYRQIRQVIDRHPEKLFMAFTPPPQTSLMTNSSEATRARALADWLKKGEFSQGARNLAVFDLYNLLADNKPGSKNYGTLRYEFRRQGLRFWRPTGDSHPNLKANQTIAPLLAKFIGETVRNFQANLVVSG